MALKHSALSATPVVNAVICLSVVHGIGVNELASMAQNSWGEHSALLQQLWYDAWRAVSHIGLSKDDLWIHLGCRASIAAAAHEFALHTHTIANDVILVLLVSVGQRPDRSAVLLSVQSALFGQQALFNTNKFLEELPIRYHYDALQVVNVECVLGSGLSLAGRGTLESLPYFNPRIRLDGSLGSAGRNVVSSGIDEAGFAIHATQGDIDLFVLVREEARIERETQRARQEHQRDVEEHRRALAEVAARQTPRKAQQVYMSRYESAKRNAQCVDAWAVRTSRQQCTGTHTVSCLPNVEISSPSAAPMHEIHRSSQHIKPKSSDVAHRNFPMHHVAVLQGTMHQSARHGSSTLPSETDAVKMAQPASTKSSKQPAIHSSEEAASQSRTVESHAVQCQETLAKPSMNEGTNCSPPALDISLTPSRHLQTEMLLRSVVQRVPVTSAAEHDRHRVDHYDFGTQHAKSHSRRVWSPPREYYTEERKVCRRNDDVSAIAVSEVASAVLRTQELYYYNPQSRRVYSFRPPL